MGVINKLKDYLSKKAIVDKDSIWSTIQKARGMVLTYSRRDKIRVCLYERLGIAFIVIGRTGSSSVTHLLRTLNCKGKILDENCQDLNIKYLTRKQLMKYHVLTSVRNPQDRIISNYTDKIDNPNNPRRFIDGVHYEFYRLGFRKTDDFDTFINGLSLVKLDDVHIKPYSEILKNVNGVNYLRTNNLQEDLNSFLHKLGIDSSEEIRYMKVSPRKDKREYHSKELDDLIKKRYSEDLKLWNSLK
jgi:hypothetical protein